MTAFAESIEGLEGREWSWAVNIHPGYPLFVLRMVAFGRIRPVRGRIAFDVDTPGGTERVFEGDVVTLLADGTLSVISDPTARRMILASRKR